MENPLPSSISADQAKNCDGIEAVATKSTSDNTTMHAEPVLTITNIESEPFLPVLNTTYQKKHVSLEPYSSQRHRPSLAVKPVLVHLGLMALYTVMSVVYVAVHTCDNLNTTGIIFAVRIPVQLTGIISRFTITQPERACTFLQYQP